MVSVALSIEHIAKEYRIDLSPVQEGSYSPLSRVRPVCRYKTLRDSLAMIACRAVRLKSKTCNKTSRDILCALKDITFEIKRGEVVGLIGRNGAGKSTLLKILSRITEPTRGRIQVRGRIASLLEVGTGFHPELTGRENIYLNGALLGMKRKEIQAKFDQIVGFAGTEKALDTPVKRYSSGMYVRLAFAVAAHLEHEILLIDEVLAVGDAEFQKRCLGKLGQVASEEGRTVLFVSHNMAAVKALTGRAIVLNGGEVVFIGRAERAIQAYMASLEKPKDPAGVLPYGRGVHTAIRAVRLLDPNEGPTPHYIPGERFLIEIQIETDGTPGLSLVLFLLEESYGRIGMGSTYDFHGQMLPQKAGAYTCRVQLEPLWLATGTYYLDVRTSVINGSWDHSVENACPFEVPFCDPGRRGIDFKQSYGCGALAWLVSSGAATFRLNEADRVMNA